MISELFQTFLNQWNKEKVLLQKKMEENKAWNVSYLKTNGLTTKDSEYKKNRKKLILSDNSVVKIITGSIPQHLRLKLGLLYNQYEIKGSVGQGMLSEVPWIGVFDRDITTSAQHGYYIVFLFKPDMSGFYLSLNQGWTQYINTYSKAEALYEIRKNANISYNLLNSRQGFTTGSIDLSVTWDLAKGYEAGNICYKYYSADNIPSDEELINDLRNLLGVYRELKGLVGNEILEIKGSLNEEEFQEEIQKGNTKSLSPGAINKKSKKQSSSSSSWPRDPNMSYTALENASFQCENNPMHKTFESASSGHQFVEAHHLIPMGFQDEFDVSIDVPENIVSLCPTCHRSFHNSIWEHRKMLATNFYEKRIQKLELREIRISLNRLLKYYSSNDNEK